MLLLPLVSILLAGCGPDPVTPQPADRVDLDEVMGVQVVSSIGPAPHDAVVRAVNAWGVAVPSDPVELVLGTAAVQVWIDGTGYGELTLDRPGSVEVGGADATAWIHAVDVDWPGFGMDRGVLPPGEALRAERATGGALVAGEQQVWWVDPGSVHPVLTWTDTAIAGLRTAHLDADGVLDALVWGGDRVVLLRGRPGGGMTWGAAWEGQGLVAGGAGGGDLSGDSLGDAVLAWADEGGRHWLQLLEGDGLWGFDAVEPLRISDTPWDLDLGDNTGEGRQQVTVLREPGSWDRFVRTGSGEYLATGPRLDLAFPSGSTLRTGFDLNQDGGDELVVVGPDPGGGASRQLWIYDLVGTSAQYLNLDTPGGRFAEADADGDGYGDLFMLYDDLEVVLLKGEEGSYRQKKLATVTAHGPLAAPDASGDRIPDLVVAGAAAWTWWTGHRDPDDEESWWELGRQRPVELGTSLQGPIAAVDLDGDPATLELASFAGDSGWLDLQLWAVDPVGEDLLLDRGSATLGTSDLEGLDLAVCDGVAWALVEGTLHRVDLSAPRVTGSMDTSATRVDCGPGPSGATAALLEGGTAVLLDDDLSEVGTADAPGATDLVLADLGGGPEVYTCRVDPCAAVRWTWGDDGEQVVALGDGEELVLVGPDGEISLPGPGLPSVGDADGDGHPDLLVLDGEHRVAVHRSTGQGVGPAEVFHTDATLVAPLVAGDADGDGHPDLWASSGGRYLQHTTAP